MATHMVHDFTGSVLRFYDAAGALLAELRYHPSERSRGDFRGRSVAAGTGVRWGLSCQDGSLVLGSCDESFGYRIHTSIAAWYVDKMVQAASEQDRVRESSPKAGDRLLVLGKMSHVPTLTHEEAEARMGMRIPRAAPVAVYAMRWTDRPTCEPPPQPVFDLSPLANLATAVAWGLALERIVTEWRAWHPAARVTWDVVDDVDVHLFFAIEGLGVVHEDRLLGDLTVTDARLCGLMFETKTVAAMAMAPHYVAPTPKPANRDAALRRFADGVTR